MKFWEQISGIWYDPDVNRHLKTIQSNIQFCWALYFIRSLEILEGKEWDIHARIPL